MKITRFKAVNFMNLTDVEIIPNSNLVMIVGKNEAGKSSILEAISCVFQGKKFDPDRPIRRGEDRAEVGIETEELTVKCVWSENRRKLTVTGLNTDGDVVAASSQQGLLKDVVGNFAFDPMRFVSLSTTVAGRREQVELVKKIVGLDFGDIDGRIAACKTKRTACNTTKATYDAQATAITVPAGTPNKEVLLVELNGKLANALEVNVHRSELIRTIASKKEYIDRTQQEILDAKKRIAEMQIAVDNKIATLSNEKELQQERGTQLVEEIQIKPINDKIAAAETINTAVRNKKEKVRLQRLALDEATKFQELGIESKKIEAEKTAMLSEAKMPVEGLSVTDDGVTYNDLPLYKNTNTAKQIEIAMGIAMADDPDLKVLRMSGNDLDPESLKAVVKMVDEKGWQCWLERIGDEESGGIYIEEGTIVK